MNTISFVEPIRHILSIIIANTHYHAKWLNTLSYLENTGARKIAQYEHPTLVQKEILKHAAEEFRHAYTLKYQIKKIIPHIFPTYCQESIFGSINTRQFIHKLELQISIILKNMLCCSLQTLKLYTYILITYAIEKRAHELYRIYDELLTSTHSPITVKAIIREEDGHLAEMEDALNTLDRGKAFADIACMLESKLTERWICSIQNELQITLN